MGVAASPRLAEVGHSQVPAPKMIYYRPKMNKKIEDIKINNKES